MRPGQRAVFAAIFFGLCMGPLLSGCGIQRPGTPAFSVSPGSLNFGTVSLNQTSSLSVTIENSGSAIVSISQAQVTGAAFSTSSPTPIEIAPGGQGKLTVQFAPTSSGAQAGTLAITGGNGETVTVPLSGTGAATAPGLSAFSCVNSSLAGASTDSCSVTLTGAAPAGGVAIGLASSSSAVSVPASVTVAAGASSATFTATAKAVTTPATATLTASAGSVTRSYTLQLQASSAASAALAALSCSNSSYTGPGSHRCTVTLTAAAAAGGFVVTLSSSSAAVTVPASVTVPAGAASATFAATVAAVSTATSATLTATAGTARDTFALQLLPPAAGPGLTADASSIGFGTVTAGTTATQSLVLTSNGTAAVTIQSASVSGAGFSVTGLTFPLTLNPGQSVTLDVQFNPSSAGAVTGQLLIASNSAAGNLVVALTGAGAVQHQVVLSWTKPASSSDAIAGYYLYRAASSGSYQLLDGSLNASTTTYTDSTVVSGTTYDYYVSSVDSSGVQSVPSNIFVAAIP